jgi:aryl-alcohol dehydrogenase-like predicted oxidoreductase
MPLDTYSLLGRTGLRVSPLGLGTMTFGSGGWHAGPETARAIFHRYVECGGNFVDTADIYAGGASEELLGQLIAQTGSRDRLVLATKFGGPTHATDPNARGNGRKHVLAALDASLRRLRTDYLDLYWLHLWDRLTPPEEVMATFDALVRSGRVRAVGLSDVPAWWATKAQLVATAGSRSPRYSWSTHWSSGRSSGSTCRRPMISGWASSPGRRWPTDSSPASTPATATVRGA